MYIESFWYKAFFGFVLLTQLVSCGPQGGFAGNSFQRGPGFYSSSNKNWIPPSSNGSSTERITQGNPDGSTTERIIQPNPDGSTTEQIIKHYSNGSTTEETIPGDPNEGPDWSSSQAYLPPVTSTGTQSSEPSIADVLSCHVCTISVSVSSGIVPPFWSSSHKF